MRIRNLLSGVVLSLVAGAALVLVASAAHASTFTFTASASNDGAAGDVTASGTLDVSGGQATDCIACTVSWTGDGGGSASLTLLTFSSPLAQNIGGGQLNGVFIGGNASGDTTFPIDGDGLVFIVGTPGPGSSSTGINAAGFNIWWNGGTSYSLYLTAPYGYTAGTASFTEVSEVGATPLPPTWMLLVAGFIGLGLFAHRGSKARFALASA
jgi:hypothetical protein